jgi:hypothetical protein
LGRGEIPGSSVVITKLMIIFSSMNDNVVTSDDVAPKKAPAKKAPAKKAAPKKAATKKTEFKEDAVDGDGDGLVQDGTEHERPVEDTPKAKKSPVKKAPVAKASSGKKFVYFDSGAAYVTKEGVRFTRENRIYEIDEEEADFLLTLDNFRLPDQLELEEYYKENN